MAENELGLTDYAFTAGYWTEAVVRGTLIFLPAAVVFALAVSLVYLLLGNTLQFSRTDIVVPRRA